MYIWAIEISNKYHSFMLNKTDFFASLHIGYSDSYACIHLPYTYNTMLYYSAFGIKNKSKFIFVAELHL